MFFRATVAVRVVVNDDTDYDADDYRDARECSSQEGTSQSSDRKGRLLLTKNVRQ